MNILIVNDHLGTGGVSRSLLNMISIIKDNYKDISIDLQLLKYDMDHIKCHMELEGINICRPYYLLNVYLTSMKKQKNIIDKSVKIYFTLLSKIIGKRRVMQLILYFIPKTKKYDIGISFANDIWREHVGGFYGGCNDFVLKKVRASKKIAWIHNDPNQLGLDYDKCYSTYQKFDNIVNVSNSCKQIFDKIIPEFKYKSKVIYNMFNIQHIKELSKDNIYYDESKINLVTVARIDNQQKRIDKIINCCNKLVSNGITNFKWNIVGDGPDLEWIKLLACKKGISKYIEFLGEKINPYPYMKNADVFILLSDYEAYGMVLTESIILGTPVITTNFPAASEVVRDNKNGCIIEKDEDNIYRKIQYIIQNPGIINQMNRYIKENEFSNTESIRQLKEVIGG